MIWDNKERENREREWEINDLKLLNLPVRCTINFQPFIQAACVFASISSLRISAHWA